MDSTWSGNISNAFFTWLKLSSLSDVWYPKRAKLYLGSNKNSPNRQLVSKFDLAWSIFFNFNSSTPRLLYYSAWLWFSLIANFNAYVAISKSPILIETWLILYHISDKFDSSAISKALSKQLIINT